MLLKFAIRFIFKEYLEFTFFLAFEIKKVSFHRAAALLCP